MILPEGSYSWSEFSDNDVAIGKHTAIARDCYFHGADNHVVILERKRVACNLDKSGHSKGKILVGSDVWIATGVKVLSGVKIGDGAIVGAWSVVSKDIPPYAVAVGNPARIVRFRFTEEQIKKLLKIKWWDWSEDKITQINHDGDFNDIEIFLDKHYD